MRDSPAKTFKDGFRSLCSNRHLYPVWADIWEIFALVISNSATKQLYACDERFKRVWDERESRYLQLIKRYDKEEIDTIVSMLAAMVEESELHPWQDFAGQMYMELQISNKNSGQFFTPYNVCSMSAKMTGGDMMERVNEKGWYTVYDCACGGGAMLIAGCEEASLELDGLDWRNHVLCVANDIDRVCACMCYVQLSLIGAAGIVTQSDALKKASVDFYEEPENVWLTPMYLSDTWTLRRLFHGLDMNMNKASMRGL